MNKCLYHIEGDVFVVGECLAYFVNFEQPDSDHQVLNTLIQWCQLPLVGKVVKTSFPKVCLQVPFLLFQTVNFFADIGGQRFVFGIQLAYFLLVVVSQQVGIFAFPPVALFLYARYLSVEDVNLVLHEQDVDDGSEIGLPVVFLVKYVEHLLKGVGLVELLGLGVALVEFHKRTPMGTE